jgi:hypothetical protein
MSVTVYVPGDAAALALGADSVAAAITAEAAKRGIDIRLVRNGSRGMLWLEPLVEVATPRGRIAYGPVAASDVRSLFAAGCLSGGAHPLHLGATDEMPWLKRQQRLACRRIGVVDPRSLDDYLAHGGWRGLEPCTRHDAGRDSASGDRLGPARARRRGLSHRHQVADRARYPGATEVHCLQCRRGRFGHLLRPAADGGRPVSIARRHGHCGTRGRRHDGLPLRPLRISARQRCAECGTRWRTGSGSAISKSRYARVPAPTSAARKPHCSKAWRAGAALFAPNRRCRPSAAFSVSRRQSTTSSPFGSVPDILARGAATTTSSAQADRAGRCPSSWPATSSTPGWWSARSA